MAERNDVRPKGDQCHDSDVDRESMKYIKTERDDPSWAAQEGQLLILASNLDLISGMRSTGTSMDISVRGVGVGLTHTEKVLIKPLKIAKETGNLEAEIGEDPKKLDIVLYRYNAIVLPQLYQTELLFRSHDQMGYQGFDKVYQRILKRFEWPGMKKACEKWVTACLSFQQVNDPKKLRFPLQSIESSEFNEVVQIDHQKICTTDSGYNQVLVMIDLITKYAEVVPCITASAEETCDYLINTWIARHGFPMTFQSDNGTAFVGKLTKELMRRSQLAPAHSTTYHPQTNG